MGSCCKDFEDTLFFHWQDIKGSGCCESLPLSYVGTENNAVWALLRVAQHWLKRTLVRFKQFSSFWKTTLSCFLRHCLGSYLNGAPGSLLFLPNKNFSLQSPWSLVLRSPVLGSYFLPTGALDCQKQKSQHIPPGA